MSAANTVTSNHVALDGVPRTALIPLWARAHAANAGETAGMQSRELMHSLDYDFSRFEKMGSPSISHFLALTIATRTREFDRQIRSFLSVHPHGVIVNVGAGLDDAFSRTDNGFTNWYDIDTGEIIGLRRRLLGSMRHPRVHEITGSVLDPLVLAQVPVSDEGVLFFFSGVLMYWNEEEIGQMLRDLSHRFGKSPGGAQVVFDALSPLAASVVGRLILATGIERAPVRWSLKSPLSIERLAKDVRLIESYPLYAKTTSCPAWGRPLAAMARCLDHLNGYYINRLSISTVSSEPR